jgi:hypothetical protein
MRMSSQAHSVVCSHTQDVTQLPTPLFLICLGLAVLVAGYYAAALSNSSITEARPCPQKYFCPGGQPLGAANPPQRIAQDTTLQLCPTGLWTQAPGATQALDCCEFLGSCAFPSACMANKKLQALCNCVVTDGYLVLEIQ